MAFVLDMSLSRHVNEWAGSHNKDDVACQMHVKWKGLEHASWNEPSPPVLTTSARVDLMHQEKCAPFDHFDDALAKWVGQQQFLLGNEMMQQSYAPEPSELPPWRGSISTLQQQRLTGKTWAVKPSLRGAEQQRAPAPMPTATVRQQSLGTSIVAPSQRYQAGSSTSATALAHHDSVGATLNAQPHESVTLQEGVFAVSQGLPSTPVLESVSSKVAVAAVQAPSPTEPMPSKTMFGKRKMLVRLNGQSMPSVDSGAATSGVSCVENEPLTDKVSTRHHRWCCIFVFLISEKAAKAFELVPRLIGRGGCNLKSIAGACKGKIRIRGRNSGHIEGPTRAEANIPLQVALSCASAENYLLGRRLLSEVLDRMQVCFAEYCQAMRMDSPVRFYAVREDLRA
eukprot:CAMPEP_0115190488 /NCGR_PEP_ID=MMETSP0270-20121206/12051_1 /TAXON_ID=71861 /ORGANISM="Scrippsiella trochoidea, Strain CCMP3099" /LENGTH=396 /DNA_ID=CAMNT_0002603701 /DNA_START=58 /DNA_END=1248 /DNA_ORIENTATION=-